MKVFIAGPRVVTELDANITKRLDKVYNSNYTVIIGDADGIDSSVQRYFYNKNYQNVCVFASNGKARNNIGNWKIENVVVEDNIKGFDFYAAKDSEMAKQADYGFMIWNGESKGTFNNIINLINMNKEVLVYYIPAEKFYTIRNMEQLDKFIVQNKKLNSKLLKLIPKKVPGYVQMSML